jgi:hypothetical protein
MLILMKMGMFSLILKNPSKIHSEKNSIRWFRNNCTDFRDNRRFLIIEKKSKYENHNNFWNNTKSSCSQRNHSLVKNLVKRKKQEPQKIEANVNGKGYTIEVHFTAGNGHNNPSFALWIESMDEKFIQEIFVTKSVSTGVYRYGDASSGKWEAGQKMYYATLPYFLHKRSASVEIPSHLKNTLPMLTLAQHHQTALF